MAGVCTASAIVCTAAFAAQYWLWKKYKQETDVKIQMSTKKKAGANKAVEDDDEALNERDEEDEPGDKGDDN